jgi:hypothetical protein
MSNFLITCGQLDLFLIMEVPKIHLSPAEKELMLNAEVILTKNSVLDKVKKLLRSIEQEQLSAVRIAGFSSQPPFHIHPKISKGENYEGLPYLILDFPRISAGTNLYFIRTMFWWGKYFSSTLHLSGSEKVARQETIIRAFSLLQEHATGIHPDPWIHHFGPENYRSIGNMEEREFAEHCFKSDHLKIGISQSLDHWEETPEFLMKNWELYLKVSGSIS